MPVGGISQRERALRGASCPGMQRAGGQRLGGGQRQGSRPRGRASAWWAGRARWRASAASWTRRTGRRTSTPGRARGSGALRATGAVRPQAAGGDRRKQAAGGTCSTAVHDRVSRHARGRAGALAGSLHAPTESVPWSARQGLLLISPGVKLTRRRRGGRARTGLQAQRDDDVLQVGGARAAKVEQLGVAVADQAPGVDRVHHHLRARTYPMSTYPTLRPRPAAPPAAATQGAAGRQGGARGRPLGASPQARRARACHVRARQRGRARACAK